MLTLPPKSFAQEHFSHIVEVRLAKNLQEIESAKRLRYHVFFEEFGADGANAQEVDSDEFDQYCDHLIAIDPRQNWVVGTYRILNSEQAKKCGKWYSESEFNLSPLNEIKDAMVEVGRSCVHKLYRNGSTIAKLWTALVSYTLQRKYAYLVGCASIPLNIGDRQVQDIITKLQSKLAPNKFCVEPIIPWRAELESFVHQNNTTSEVSLPPLLKGYLRAGAWVCGAPAHDTQFHTADVLVLLSLDKVESRYKRHFVHN